MVDEQETPFERLTGATVVETDAPKGKKGTFVSGGEGRLASRLKAELLSDEEVEAMEADDERDR